MGAGVNERVISRDAKESGLFGPCLFVYGEMDDVPAQWYRFGRGLFDKNKAEPAKMPPDRKQKRDDMKKSFSGYKLQDNHSRSGGKVCIKTVLF